MELGWAYCFYTGSGRSVTGSFSQKCIAEFAWSKCHVPYSCWGELSQNRFCTVSWCEGRDSIYRIPLPSALWLIEMTVLYFNRDEDMWMNSFPRHEYTSVTLDSRYVLQPGWFLILFGFFSPSLFSSSCGLSGGISSKQAANRREGAAPL